MLWIILALAAVVAAAWGIYDARAYRSEADARENALALHIKVQVITWIAVAVLAIAALVVAAPMWAIGDDGSQPAAEETTEGEGEESDEDESSADLNEADQAAKEALDQTVYTLNNLDGNDIIPADLKVIMSRESFPSHDAERKAATGVEDAVAFPYTKDANEAIARQETRNEFYDEARGTSNTIYVLGWLDLVATTETPAGRLIDQDVPELKRILDKYHNQGMPGFALTDENGILITEPTAIEGDKTWFINDDAKSAAIMAIELLDCLDYHGIQHKQTARNFHVNVPSTPNDRIMLENPKQYEGEFHVWGLPWKGQGTLLEFGTNCGSAEGPGDKRPAVFCEPEPEPATTEQTHESAPGTGGGSPTPNTNTERPKPTPNTEKPRPNTEPDQPTPGPIKNPEEDPVHSGDAPVGGGIKSDPGPGELETIDHPAESSGASPDSGDSDGMDKSSNQVQNPSAAQDNSATSEVKPIPVTRDITVTDNTTGQTTNTSKEKSNKGKVILPD